MCNQMVMSEKGSGNFEDLEKTQWKFSLISRVYDLITYFNIKISWVTINARFWHVFPGFIVSIENYTLSKV